jgi:hypothetical protein
MEQQGKEELAKQEWASALAKYEALMAAKKKGK